MGSRDELRREREDKKMLGNKKRDREEIMRGGNRKFRAKQRGREERVRGDAGNLDRQTNQMFINVISYHGL